MNVVKYILVVFLIVSFKTMIYAQSDRYWSNSFNTDASLLAGAVVGGGSDITSSYYNPAGISEIEEKKFILNTNLFRLDIENYNDLIEKNNNIKDLSFRVQPRFMSYIYRSKKYRNLSWQIAFFNRDMDYKSYSSTIEAFIDKNKIIKSFDYYYEFSDYWGGLGASYEISEKFKVGVSTNVSVKNLAYNTYQFYTFFNNETGVNIAESDSYERIMMYYVNFVAKIGMRFNLSTKTTFGLNITTPSLKLFGNGDVKKKINLYNQLDSLNYVKEENLLYRDDDIKSPMSVALGLTHSFTGKDRVYFSMEWFAKQKKYKIIDGTKVVKSEEGNYPEGTDFSTKWFETKSIVNFAIGYKQRLSENFELLLGFRTDFNAYENSNINSQASIIQVHNDLYHYTLGSKFNYKKASFILGFQYSYGQKDEALLYKSNWDNSDYIDYSIHSIGLYFGFTLDF